MDYQRILITGASGFVGRYLLPALAGAYPACRIFAFGLHRHKLDRTAVEYRGDITDFDTIATAVKDCKPDLIIHLAAQSSVASAAAAPFSAWQTNAVGTLLLSKAVSTYSPASVFLFTSSADVYGESFRAGPVTEETTPRPLNIYARSKLAAEQILADTLSAETSLLVARPFSHSGPYQDKRFLLPSIAAQIARIECGNAAPRITVGNLDLFRDYLDVRDVVSAYLAVLARASTLPRRFIFNVSSGQASSLRSLVEQLLALSTQKIELISDPGKVRSSDLPVVAGSNDRIRSMAGWMPRNNIGNMLRELKTYWVQTGGLK
jgi:GDP-4-dehydro-6-deoxy-D-mannose reductase